MRYFYIVFHRHLTGLVKTLQVGLLQPRGVADKDRSRNKNHVILGSSNAHASFEKLMHNFILIGLSLSMHNLTTSGPSPPAMYATGQNYPGFLLT